MEVDQGPNWSCSTKEKKINSRQKFIISFKFWGKFRKRNIHISVKDFAVIRLSERAEADSVLFF
jgi:hypothetical protein